eukprot:5839138-Ditylum_brightwellii.AAC.2
MQQWYALMGRGIEKSDPRHQFLQDIQEKAEELTDKGHEVILALDANEDVVEKQGLSKLANVLSLIDVHEHFHQSSPHPHTNKEQRGLTTYLQHWLEEFFLEEINNPMDFITRQLIGFNPIITNNYLQQLEKCFDHSKIPERVAKL